MLPVESAPFGAADRCSRWRAARRPRGSATRRRRRTPVAARSSGERGFRRRAEVVDRQDQRATRPSAVGEAQAFEVGAPNVSLNDVMVDMQKANVGFQFGLQVRNKLVSAYNDIMQISV